MNIAAVCQPLATRPPNGDVAAACSSTWNGCGSYSRANATISARVTRFRPSCATSPARKSSK